MQDETIKPEHELSGLKILKQAKRQNGKFLLTELDEEMGKIVKAIRQSPQKNGSLNIHVAIKPGSTDGEIMVATAEIKNVKIPQVDVRPIHAFATMTGKMVSKDPSQSDFVDETSVIDSDTGEVKDIKDTSNIKSIK